MYGKRFVVGGAALVAAAAMVGSPAFAATTVTGLEANANAAPLGIDDATPTLSWRLSSSDRGAMQSKYRVVVATTAARAAAGTGDVWDSGEVTSDRNTAVYAGPALTSRTRYYWSVRSWTGATPSDWAPAGWFETAYLNRSQWQGSWISGPERLAVVPTAAQGTAERRLLPAGLEHARRARRRGRHGRAPGQHRQLLRRQDGHDRQRAPRRSPPSAPAPARRRSPRPPPPATP